MGDVFLIANLVEDRGGLTTSSEYHKILFKTSYYNSYSLLMGMDILHQHYRNKKKKLSPDDLNHLSEPFDEISLYEFMTNEHTDLDINKFKDKLVKLIKEIHYHHVSGDGSEVTYVQGRYSRPLESTRNILMALLETR